LYIIVVPADASGAPEKLLYYMEEASPLQAAVSHFNPGSPHAPAHETAARNRAVAV
jgi:hypothetical protein